MTARDRLMLMAIAALAVLAAVWFTAVVPERERASKVTAEVEAARRSLASAEAQAREAQSARARYSTAYTSLLTLGQAVPASSETPALIYTLDEASHSHDIQFSSIVSGSSGSGGGSSSAAASTASGAGLSQQPFTFVFSGSFVDLSRLLSGLEGFTVLTPSGPLRVSGRLLTIDSLSLTPNTSATQSVTGARQKTPELTGTIAATAYVLPAGVSTTAGATAAGPAAAQPASSPAGTSTGGSDATTTAAVVKANP